MFSIKYLYCNREFELTNHLGNVQVTISDKRIRIPNPSNPQQTAYYLPVVLTTTDYYPFGMQMPSRTFTATTGVTYKFGFNDKMNDNEITGWQDYGMREYDTRIARFVSVDPLTRKYPMLTPYQFASGCPISGVDLDGLEYFFAANGVFLGKIGKSTDVRVTTSYDVKNYISWANNNTKSKYRKYATKKALENSTSLNISIKDFLDRNHFNYGEGGNGNVYIADNGTKEGIVVNPAQYFADAIQNGVDKFGSEEEMKRNLWTNGDESYSNGKIKTSGRDDSGYNTFNDARTKFENGDQEAFNSPEMLNVFAATITALKNPNSSSDLVNGAYNWCSGGQGDTFNGLVSKRDPVVRISSMTLYYSVTNTFYLQKKPSSSGKTDLSKLKH